MVRVDRRLAYHVDVAVLLLVLAIVGCGVATLYSATYRPDHPALGPLVTRQIVWAGIGFAGLFASLAVDYRRLERSAYTIYGLVVLLLVLVPLVGFIGGGSRRWIDLGFFALQPSELAKLAIIIVLARYFHRERERDEYGLADMVVPTVLFLVPAGLIVVQPDLGSAALLGLVFGSIVMIAGLRVRTVAWSLGALSLVGAYGGRFLWEQLREYQQKRIIGFLNPETDPLGAGYHVIQSQIAIGSGKTWGKGFLEGTQNKLHFLPEQHTDFIFSVFAEEWGLFGCAVLLALYALLIVRGLQIAVRAKDRFGALLAFGVVAILFWHAFINLAMAMGVMPVVGITLPFFSYGGSSMVTLMVGVGLMLNVSMRRFLF